jgi:filamentous hemagglutinin family protein
MRSHFHELLHWIFSILLLFLLGNLRLEALPSISHVAHGKANIVANGNELLVEAADKTILNYVNFDILSHETVRFQMADETHRVLNRICSDMASYIDGRLLSNGIVYLLNPAGILFGSESVVNVAALYVAAAHLSDRDFIQGIDRFEDIQGAIDIYGTISAQEVALIGKSIFQKGNIIAEEGQVLFVTADHVYLGKEGGHLFVKCDKLALQEAREKPCFFETGTSAAFVLHHTGTSKASKIHLYAGDDSLVTVSGNLDVSQMDNAGKGGEVQILGEVISLECAVIEASGSFGGGEVWIGGGKHGEGLYPTAQYTLCDKQTSIHTDAISRGNGGEIILWADEATVFDAKLFSRGGAIEGNGGYIETSSGDRFRAMTGFVDASAVHGRGGQWDLDPCSVTISSTATVDTPSTLICTAAGISSGMIPSLNDGCACANPVPACTPPGSTTPVVDYIVMASCLESVVGPTTIIIGANASSTNSTFISLGDNQGATPATVNITNPNVSVSLNSVNGAAAPNNRGTIFLNGSFTTTGTLTFTGNTLIIGDTTIQSTAANVTFDDPINASSSTPPNLTVQAAGAISFGIATNGAIGQISPLNSLTVTTSGNNDISFAAGAFTLNDILIQSQPPASPPGNTITLHGPSTFLSVNGNITFDGILNSDTPSTPQDLILNAGGNITFGNFVGSIPLGNVLIETADNVLLSSQTNPLFGNYTMVVASFTQLAGTGNTSFQGPLITSGAPVQLGGDNVPSPPTNGGNVSITTAGDINFYYLVQAGGGPTLSPVLSPSVGDVVAFKSVITTTGGRQSSSVSIPTNPNAPNGLNGGSVTLMSGGSINLLAIYAGGTPAFPGTTGIGGSGGNISISSVNGTVLQGPIFATGGAGVSGGSEVLPSLIFPGQDFSTAGTGSPGNIEIVGPLTLGFNGIILRGGNITIGDIVSDASNLLGIDASTSGIVELGALSNLSYFDVDYALGVTVNGFVTAEGVALFNAGSENIEFVDLVVATDITAIANDFCVIFEEGFTADTSLFLNTGICPSPPTPPPVPPARIKPRGRGFAGVWFPSFDVYYYPGDVFYYKDDIFLDLNIPKGRFYQDYLEKPKVVKRLR